MGKRKKFERIVDIIFYGLLGLAFVIFPEESANYSFYIIAIYFVSKSLYLFALYLRQKLLVMFRYLAYVYLTIAIIAALLGGFGQGVIQLFSIFLGIFMILCGLGGFLYTTKYIPRINTEYRKQARIRDIFLSISSILLGVFIIIIASLLQKIIFISFGIILLLGTALGLYFFIYELKSRQVFQDNSENQHIHKNAIETEIIEIKTDK